MMRFSKPVTYGHWANFIFSARDVDHNVTIIPDFDAGINTIAAILETMMVSV